MRTLNVHVNKKTGATLSVVFAQNSNKKYYAKHAMLDDNFRDRCLIQIYFYSLIHVLEFRIC